MRKIIIALIAFLLSAVLSFAQQNYTGDGGSGRSIAIIAPRAVGLPAELEYLPVLVQGELVSNFTAFSAISVLDRQNYETQLFELMNEMYSDRARERLNIGNLPHTDYLMDGTITRTATGYNLQIRILRTSDQTTAAAHSETFTFLELDNLTGVRRASAELLEKMGVTLTTQARNSLIGAATSRHVRAQTALAQGIVAQRQGTEVTALSYFYQAAAFDTTLVEAIGRSQIVAADISSGRTRSTNIERPHIERTRPNIERTQTSNIGENIRNEIQRHRDSIAREEAWRRDSIAIVTAWRRDSTAAANAWLRDSTERDNAWRRDWIARLKETEEVFYNIINSAAPPYSLHYTTDIQTSNINYRTETADLGIFARVEANAEWFSAMQNALRTVQSVMTGLNATGRKNDWGLERWPLRGVSNNNPFNRSWTHNIRAVFELVDERGRVIGRESVEFDPSFNIAENFTIATPRNIGRAVTFTAVKADDISDQLTIRISRINRRPPEAAQIPISVITEERELAVARRERELAFAEAARVRAEERALWSMGTFGMGGAFRMGEVDPAYYGALIFGGNYELFQKRLSAIRFGIGFDWGIIGGVGINRNTVKKDHPDVDPNDIDEATIRTFMTVADAYVKLHPVNFLYVSGGAGYGSYGRYHARGEDGLDLKGKNRTNAPIFSAGGGIVIPMGNDINGGFVIDVQYHMVQSDNSSGGYITIKFSAGSAMPFRSQNRN